MKAKKAGHWGAVVILLLLLLASFFLWLACRGLPKDSAAPPPVADLPCPNVMYVDADATALDFANVLCEQLVDMTFWGLDDIGVAWQDGLVGCEMIEGLDVLVGDEVFQAWRCGLPGGIQFDWRNVKRSHCYRETIILGGD